MTLEETRDARYVMQRINLFFRTLGATGLGAWVHKRVSYPGYLFITSRLRRLPT